MAGTEYLILLLSIIGFLTFGFFQTDERYSPRIFDKVIPKNSFWRKFYPFKEDSKNPLKYVKFIPFVISTVILIIVFIIYIIYWINPTLMIDFLRSKLVFFGFLSYLGAAVLYAVIFLE